MLDCAGVRVIDTAQLGTWKRDSTRTTYTIAVRTIEEFSAAHATGSVTAFWATRRPQRVARICAGKTSCLAKSRAQDPIRFKIDFGNHAAPALTTSPSGFSRFCRERFAAHSVVARFHHKPSP